METTENKSRKEKRVKINTPNGVRYLTYKPAIIRVDDEGNEIKELICNQCSYYKKCDKFLNPETPADKESSFQEFCSDLGTPTEGNSKIDTSLIDYIPVEGTLEENISDLQDVYEVLIKKNGFVKLVDIIDCVCKESCPYWNKEHTDCKSTNEFCLLEDLIKKSNV